jgi:hypothetical protein
MTWEAPLALGWLALLGLVGLFYLLRPQRQRILVASLLLWKRTLQREEKQTWLDWLKRHLLLILQLLAVAALVLALASPQCAWSRSVGPPVAVVVDASLSMQIADVGRSRLEAAKDQAIAFIRSLSGGARISVLSAGGTTKLLTMNSTDRFETEAAIGGVQQTAAEGSIPATLDIALSLAPRAAGGMVALFSDGAFELPAGPAYHQVTAFIVAGETANIAVEDFAVRRQLDASGSVQGLVTVRNDGSSPAVVAVRVEATGVGVAHAQVRADAESRASLLFDDLGVAHGYSATLGNGSDGLDLDNVAFAELTQPRELRVLVVGVESAHIVRALQASPGVLAAAGAPADFDNESAYDVYVFQEWLPEVLPDASIVLVRPPDDGPLGLVALGPVESTLRVSRDSALMAHVDSLGITLAQAKRYKIPAQLEVDLDVGGGAVLAHGVAFGRRLVVVGLDVVSPVAAASPWFPVFWNNVVHWADPFNPLPDDGPMSPDRPELLVPHPQADEFEVIHPGGSSQEFSLTTRPVLEPRETGTYVVRQYRGDDLLAQSTIVVAPPPREPNTGAAIEMSGATKPTGGHVVDVPESTDVWPLFAALALAVLIFEWWWFHRARRLR